MRIRLWSLIAFASLAVLWLLYLSEIPLGVPGEWTWLRTPVRGDWWWSVIIGSVLVAAYAAFAWCGARRMRQAGSLEAAAWLCGLVLAGCGWIAGVVETTPDGLGLGRSPFVLFYTRTSGYFFEARSAMQEFPEYISSYERRISEGDDLHLHIGTHPPGLAMMHAALLAACRHLSELMEAVPAARPASVVEATDTLASHETSLSPQFDQADAAALWLATLLTLVTAAAAVLPLYGLLRRDLDRETTWRVASLWPLLPTLAVFFPKSDLLYPLPAMLFAWLWLTGWERGSYWRCAAASLVLFTGMLLSLAFLPVAAIVGLASLLLWRRRPVTHAASVRHRSRHAENMTASHSAPPPSRWIACIAAGAAVFVAGLVAFAVVFDLNLLNVWRLNFINHAAFYDHNPRTWWKWLLVNPVELAVAAGPVVALTALWGAGRVVSNGGQRPLSWSVILVWGLLWLSGKNMGEAARLWILLTPWLLVLAANGRPPASAPANEQPQPRRQWLLLLGIQALLCVLTAHRIDGFHFTDL